VGHQREYEMAPGEEEVASKFNSFYRIKYVIEEFQYSLLYIILSHDSDYTMGSGWKPISFEADYSYLQLFISIHNHLQPVA
jgi:hypothetical protein